MVTLCFRWQFLMTCKATIISLMCNNLNVRRCATTKIKRYGFTVMQLHGSTEEGHLGEAIAHVLSLVQQKPPPGDGRQGTVRNEIALGVPQRQPRSARATSLMHLCQWRGALSPQLWSPRMVGMRALNEQLIPYRLTSWPSVTALTHCTGPHSSCYLLALFPSA